MSHADLGQFTNANSEYFFINSFWINVKLSENKHPLWKLGSNSKPVEGKLYVIVSNLFVEPILEPSISKV